MLLYHYPIHQERLVIGKFCSIACGTKFLFNCTNHTLKSLSTLYISFILRRVGIEEIDITDAWDDKGDIIIGNDVWIGYEAVIMAGVPYRRWGDYWCTAVVTKRCSPDNCRGTPQKIRETFWWGCGEEIVRLQWWDWSIDEIRCLLAASCTRLLDDFLNNPSSVSCRSCLVKCQKVRRCIALIYSHKTYSCQSRTVISLIRLWNNDFVKLKPGLPCGQRWWRCLAQMQTLTW